ncbi:hypothetical protein L6452_02585 [Arctium lappa]|uniref:Uncharacterized protein n=1 Tax=Arctium lappa TaxID=4217 RepID=A0ACB9FKQ8_ARCLA|nr:hypothetical protein L6452_02585 [Arctium lappa]
MFSLQGAAIFSHPSCSYVSRPQQQTLGHQKLQISSVSFLLQGPVSSFGEGFEVVQCQNNILLLHLCQLSLSYMPPP